MFSRIFIDLERIFAIYRDREAGAGSLEVVVRLSPRPRPHFLMMMPFGHDVLVGDVSPAKIIAGSLLVWARLVRCWIVGQNQRVLAVLVVEIVVDSLFLHQPRRKIKVCFAVLHTIVSRREVAIKTKLEILKIELFEDLLNDIGNLLVLKDSAIRFTGD